MSGIPRGDRTAEMTAGRRLTLWVCSTATVVVLLFSYHTSTSGSAVAGHPQAAGVVSGAVPPAAAPAAPATPSGPTRASRAPAPAALVVNGSAADTRYGPVQVQIRVSGGRITAARAIEYPQGGRDSEINDVAIPALDSAALQAQSARIDTVSGATYTSDGYRRSLQAALDAAHLS